MIEPLEPTEPMTDAELGVLGAQAAAAEPRKAYVPLNGDQLGEQQLRERLVGLVVTSPAGDTLTPEEVVRRAKLYLDFIQGGTDGRAG